MNPVMIVHKETGKIWRSTSGKVGWKEPSHAKKAWANSCVPQVPSHLWTGGKGWSNKPLKFDDQDEYEIIFIDEALEELYGLRYILESLEK